MRQRETVDREEGQGQNPEASDLEDLESQRKEEEELA